MSSFVPWNSQPLEEWARKHATGKFITLDGHSTHYIEKGAGEPVILVHGFFYDSYMWHENIAALAERFKVYALDLWGFGYSSREPMDYGYPLYAHQLLQFMDTLNIQKASLVGQSMGGGTCIFFSTHHRARVHKLILVDPGGMPNPMPPLGKIANLPRVGEFLYGLNRDFPRKITLSTTWIYDRALITDKYFENVTRFQKIQGTTQAMLKILRKQFFDTLAEEIRKLSELEIPILIVWGRHDKAIPLERGQRMNNILKGSRLEIFERAGHCPHDEQPQQFNALALEFLAANQ